MKIITLSVFVAVFALTGCGMVSKNFRIDDADFTYEDSPHNFLPLSYHDRSSIKKDKAKEIIGGILAEGNTDSSTYGYYYVNYNYDKKREVFMNVGGVIIFVPIKYVLAALGIPLNTDKYELSAEVFLFDSKGDIVGVFERKKDFTKYNGLYYGATPIDYISSEYKRMFGEILDDIEGDIVRMNALLEKAGVLHTGNDAAAYTEIYKIIKIK